MLFGSLFFEWIQTVLILAGYVSGNAAFPKPLSPEEEKEYLKLYEQGDENAKNILIERNLRLAAHIAKKYSDESNAEDIISIGTIGLIKGVNTFKSSKSCKLSSYISRCIENEILMYMRSAKKLSNEVSIDESIGTDKEGNNMTFSDVIMADNAEVSDEVFMKLETQKLYKAMKKALTPDEQRIICQRYGLGGIKRRTQKEIADDLGISRSYISRIEKRCIGKLAAEFKA